MCQLSCRGTVLFKVLHCKSKNVFFGFFLFFFLYEVCEKDNRPITVQHWVADGVSCLPRLTWLDLQTDRADTCVPRMELVGV